MYCTNCGNQLEDGARFCSKCGSKVADTFSKAPDAGVTPPPVPSAYNVELVPSDLKKNSLLKIIVPLIIGGVFAVIILILGLNGSLAGSNKFITMVKTGHPLSFPNQTYEEEFEDFFTNPKWQYFKSVNQQDIVQFDGDCSYDGKPAHVVIQFDVNLTEKTFNIYALEIDGKPQNSFSILQIQNKIFQK